MGGNKLAELAIKSHSHALLQVFALWHSVFMVELLVAAIVVPLQFASLAVITLPVTIPIIVSLQAAAPAAALEGVSDAFYSAPISAPAVPVPIVFLLLCDHAASAFANCQHRCCVQASRL